MRLFKLISLMIWGVAAVVCCAPNRSATPLAELKESDFRAIVDGDTVALYRLTNGGEMEVAVTNFGARIVSIMVRDRDGEFQDVALGFDNIKDYVDKKMAIGATVGRFAGRIANGELTVDGVDYRLGMNDDIRLSTVHGGAMAWMNRVYKVEQVEPNSILLSFESASGESGFPGNIHFEVRYTLTADNSIDIDYYATSDAPTVLNVTNHTFFNLSGDYTVTNEEHEMVVEAERFVEINCDRCLPTGRVIEVADTPMDFRQKRVIGDYINDYSYAQLKANDGYDHKWVFDRKAEYSAKEQFVKGREQLWLHSPKSGITMRTYTSQPTVLISSAGYLNGANIGKGGLPLIRRGGICIETQSLGTAGGHGVSDYDYRGDPTNGGTLLTPDNAYRAFCRYSFSVE